MDFSNRSTQPQPVASSAHAPAGPQSAGHRKSNQEGNKWNRLTNVLVVAAVVVLLVALLVAVGFNGGNNDNEGKYVDTNKLQAVFLNTGQVYFGNVKKLNNQYVVLTNIYYLQTSNSSSTTTNANANVSLVKLGCELHEPYDQMVINRSQVTFWENLQDGGQVAKAVKTFEQQNPNGQKCSDQSSAASTTSGNSAQNAGTSNSSSTTPAAKP